MAPVAGYPGMTAENGQGHRKFNSYNLPEWVRHPLVDQPEKVAILFPGEQNHSIGMLKDAKKNSEVQKMLDTASRVFGYDIDELMTHGPMDKMAKTSYNQPLIYVADCAAYEMLKLQYPKVAAKPQGVAGFSVGEYSALYAAGVITFEQGCQLVQVRAQALEACTEESDMDAIAVWGFGLQAVESLCSKAMKRDDINADPKVYVARVLGPDGIVCAGRKSTVLKLQELALKDAQSEEKGVRGDAERKANDKREWEGRYGMGSNDQEQAYINAEIHNKTMDSDAAAKILADKASKFKEIRLLGSHAGHTPLVQTAATAVANALDAMLPQMQAPRCELYLNATGWRVPAGADPKRFVSALKEQLTSPVMWEGTIDQMQRWGIANFYECGPGRSLKFYMQGYEFISEAPLVISHPGQNVVNVTV